MKARNYWKPLAALTGAVAGAAALNAVVARPLGSLPNLIGGDAGWYDWRGYRIAWTRRGTGPALLLVHSIHAAGWSYEWRHDVDPLAAGGHTVWTLDLLGFGRSDRPDVDYSARLYVDLLRDFISEAIAEPTVLVGSSLSAAHAVAVAAGFRTVTGLVLVGAPGLNILATPPTPVNDATRAMIDAPLAGQALYNALVTKPSMGAFLRRTYYDSARVTPELLDAYSATAHQPGARHAPAAFIGQALNLYVGGALARVRQPILLTWGREAKEVPLTELDAYRAIRPDAAVRTFEACGSLPHDEKTEAWCAAVLEFTAGVRGAGAARGTATVSS
ncbi:alpha/beta hydrolase [Gemmatimonadetes bacterium T265]|nr:alpha/beta hydrolase [Gemmatimonadetes bacterium T265]